MLPHYYSDQSWLPLTAELLIFSWKDEGLWKDMERFESIALLHSIDVLV